MEVIMAKKKLRYFIPGAIACVLGIAAFCMMFLQAISYGEIGGESIGYTGAQLAFGYKQDLVVTDVTVWSFNIMIFLGFLLPLAGGILSLITGNGLLTKIITTACFVVGAVFLFSLTAYLGIGEGDSLGSIIGNNGAKLAIGPILGGVFAVLGAVVCFFKGTIAKKIG